ncbi:MAG: isoleucine--tRNA ligase [Bacteriovoracaceae bacterium]|nr:isoleucine--tRNA ligase [Bacteriovoracaceae bacterium]
MFEDVESRISFVELESQVLKHWRKHQIEEKSLSTKGEEVIFYDGPPFPTGTPHHGTILVSVLKDCIARFFSMKGFAVPRVWGWDCHGLPIENQAEKILKIKNKHEIESVHSVTKFNNTCRELVSQYNESWRQYINRVARWVDYDNSYKTLDKNYMESVLWVFKQCYDLGLIYKDHRVTPYCYKCETSLSISDTRESDSTRLRQDPTLIVKFEALQKINNKKSYYLAWTTTPWTLVSNLALTVGADIDYIAVESSGEVYILAEFAFLKLKTIFNDDLKIVKKFKGQQLQGEEYLPLFFYFENAKKEGAFKIILGDFVTTEEGVGIVHTAPAFGEDDYWVCRKNDITCINPVDETGQFSDVVTHFKGMNVISANKEVIRLLKSWDKVLEHKTLEHNYPHCWRCREPLIHRAMEAWYFNVEKIKKKLIKNNQQINWTPKSVKFGRFGKWLEGARDWNISRNRYWGTPIPVWSCSACDSKKVMGSIEELQKYSDFTITDLHKEFLDKIKIPCSKCNTLMNRVPEVLDCWFESSSMPMGQCHYPFENQKWFESHFPADFIVEYPGQIRGWFYYLHVISTALFDRPAFSNCVVHGTLLAEDGTKISKSKQNYTDALELLDTYGADSLRVYLINSPAAIMQDLRFTDQDIGLQTKNVLLPIWNAYSFFVTYAKLDAYTPDYKDHPKESNNVLDQWIHAKLFEVVEEVTDAFNNYNINQTLRPILDFIDSFTNWYVRRSRKRVWGSEVDQDKKQCYDTLHYCLINLVKLLAPSTPFISDKIYTNLTMEESVHLSAWPVIPKSFQNRALLQQVQLTRDIAALGLSLRQKKKVKTRLPLRCLQIGLPSNLSPDMLRDQLDVLKDELNVKKISFIDDPKEIAHIKAIPNAKKLGPALGADMAEFLQSCKGGQIEIFNDVVKVYGEAKVWEVSLDDIAIGYSGKDGFDVASNAGIIVSMDFHVDEKLQEEGVANDLNRYIQDLRKEIGLNVSDRVYLSIEGALSNKWKKKLLSDALSVSEDVPDNCVKKEVTILNELYVIKIKKFLHTTV